MNPPPTMLCPEEARSVLSTTLREVYGADTRLEDWSADPQFTRYGKQRVVRYDLDARVAGLPHLQHCQWVGKFYERDDDARKVAMVLRNLPATDGAQGCLALPRALAYYAPRHLLLVTFEAGEPVSSA